MKTVPGPSNHVSSQFKDKNGHKRTSELANKTFTRAKFANDTSAGDSLEHVVTVPRNEVAIVDDVFLTCSELQQSTWSVSQIHLLAHDLH